MMIRKQQQSEEKEHKSESETWDDSHILQTPPDTHIVNACACSWLCVCTCVSFATVSVLLEVSQGQEQQKQTRSCATRRLFHESSRNLYSSWPVLAAFSPQLITSHAMFPTVGWLKEKQNPSGFRHTPPQKHKYIYKEMCYWLNTEK